ncbi:vacuolar protein sorting-associated protein 37D [Rhinatrema bivittatum]|uniref:vacuolar protein sorting-associated protein 37D n=1 Tax=Rhinatrema bivittatum TaxID=194408 RepID=UPI00112807F5|nr:vacuolar protein sorting-associated protein 37D [Rhinatrema bivittatum]
MAVAGLGRDRRRSMLRTRGSPPALPGRGAHASFGSLSTAQLLQILYDEPKLQRIIQLSKKVQSLKNEQERYAMANFVVAKQNLSLRPWLENGKASLAMKYQQLQEVKTACQEKQRKLETHLQKWSLHVATHIQVELKRAEAESEAQVERFLEGILSLDGFLETFQDTRKVLHLRRTQLEKVPEVLQRDQRIQRPSQARLLMAAYQSPQAFKAPLSQHPAAPRTYRLASAFLIPSDAVASFPLPSAPPSRILPPLSTPAGQCQVSQTSRWSLGPPQRLPVYIPFLGPKPFKSKPTAKQYQSPH